MTRRLPRTWLPVILVVGVVLGGGTASAFAQPATPTGSAPAGVTGEHYASPSYGYTLDWTAAWTAQEAFSQGGYDALHLSNGVSNVFFEAQIADKGDPVTCLQRLANDLRDDSSVGDVAVVPTEGATPGVGTAAPGAAAIYTFTVTDDATGSHRPYVAALLCHTLVPGAAVLAITALVPADTFAAQADPLRELLGGLALPSAAAATPAASPAAGAASLAFLPAVERDVDAYWTDAFPPLSGGKAYTPPTFVGFEGRVGSACGAAETGDVGPFYCPQDSTVYLDLPMLREKFLPFGEFAVAFTVAHEVGHHIQHLLDLKECTAVASCLNGYTSIQLELQADCFGGAWAQSVEARQLFQGGALEQAVVALAALLGDPPNVPATDPTVHGPGSLRTWWFLRGYYEGPKTCLA